MPVPFSELPGRHERHYRRRLDNRLFARPATPDDEQLLEAQRLDHEELLAFISALRDLVQRAVDLKSTEESEVVLKLKEDLERLYETSAGLADDQSQNQQAIHQLLAVVMRTISANTGGDSLAEQELDMEARARTLHFEMLATPLVADLLHPQSLIEPDQLAATLLSETAEAVGAAMQLFDQQQRAQLAGEARALLETVDPDRERSDAWQRLAEIES